MENKGIKMSKGLKQEIKEEPFSDPVEDAVNNEGIKMFESLKQEIKEEPSSDDAEDGTESKGIKMFKSLKQEIKEEPSSGDNDDEDDDDEEDEDDEDDEDDDDEEDEDDEDYKDLSPDVAIVKSENNYKKGAMNRSAYAAIAKEKLQECLKRTVIISHVPKEINISALQKEFSQFGIIESMRLKGNVPGNPNLPGKVAADLKKIYQKIKTVSYFIRYKNEDSVKKALSMNGMKWDGNIVKVKVSRDKQKFDMMRSVYVANLPPGIKNNGIRRLFKQCGPINTVNLFRSRKTGPKLGRGYINFESVDGAVEALNLDGTTIRNCEIRVLPDPTAWKKVRRIEKNKEKLKRTGKTKTVYLPNLPITIEDNEVREFFKQCGPINFVKMSTNRKKRKCLRINFESVDGAKMAVGLNGTTIKNHKIHIEADYTGKIERQIENESRKRSLSRTANSASLKKRRTANLAAVGIAYKRSES